MSYTRHHYKCIFDDTLVFEAVLRLGGLVGRGNLVVVGSSPSRLTFILLKQQYNAVSSGEVTIYLKTTVSTGKTTGERFKVNCR